MPETLTIEPRYNGPRGAGQGGYVAGRFAGLVGAAAEVTLRKPVPLGRALAVERSDGAVRLLDDGALVAEARATEPALDVPPPPDWAEAEAAAVCYQGFDRHPVPACYVCGTERPDGDGLRLFTGPVAGRDMVAGPWVPSAALADGDGRVRPEYLWAVLDCPSGWALLAGRQIPIVLGRLTAAVVGDLRAGERCVVAGWRVGQDGRKLLSGAALFGEAGALKARAAAVWFAVGPEGTTI